MRPSSSPSRVRRVAGLLAAIVALATAATAQDAQVPCSVLRSAAHGVILLGARVQTAGGPPCALMDEYRDWLLRSDSLVLGRLTRAPVFTGREWDYASGAMRMGTPTFFLLIRGDSITAARPYRPRRLYLTALAADESSPLDTVGSWYVLVDEDSTSSRMFRPAFTERRLRRVLEDDEATVLATPGVKVDAAVVRRQLAEARALRRALGFGNDFPPVRYVLGRAGDSTLAMLGVQSKHRPIFAMTVFPPLVVFSPASAGGGLDAHELVHVATFGRRDVVPAGVGEGFAMHHGGSHGRTFDAAFCANAVFRGLPPLSASQLDSAMAGRWWNDARADVSGFALGHAMGWFLRARADSAWVFAEGEPARDTDALAYLAQRAGIARATALAEIARTLEERRVACGGVSPPAAVVSPAARPRSRRQGSR